ncbi:UTP--glucose-1-phosphate uridylyltransferase [Paramagnetospirillum magnetotacticum MS-1]|uniref:UTP--glucose-1-phosphate uridylyltransferase n=1 Tax=Paramagnetospirillum magnetotacticum MS-1 TaxID=272627 RepID=A0A0C2YRI8_PARME|nr:UTP--glucose-1-phosphate uridylyltransferase GalU [Paramagnetospirillum magnetotacticum]KIL97325.1 UTP--glucose-1-phosphate uridylyltransferase [Paramagnetospirillum magnetotacticum MS-1]
MTRRVRKAVFPVGGMGTRFLPATKAMPKEMLPVVDKPLIQYAVEEAAAAGCEHFIFVTGRGKNALEDHFDHNPELERILKDRGKFDLVEAVTSWMPKSGQISYTRQSEPLGLGHAVWCARDLVADEPFAVLLPDDLILSKTACLKQMAAVHTEVGGHVVAVSDVPREHTKRYGILDVEHDNGRLARAKGLVEKPDPEVAPSTLSIIGRYILHPAVFDVLDKKEKGAGGEIQLTDAISQTIGMVPFHGLRFEGARFDCGDKVGWLEANLAFALARDDMAEAARDLITRFHG